VTLKNVDGRDVGAKQSFVASHGHDDPPISACKPGPAQCARRLLTA
jgi:hypothetical protein